jgi:hypothetical protein
MATFLSAASLEALSLQEWQLSSVPIRVNGVRMNVSLSDNPGRRFRGLDILGMDFLVKIDGTLQIDVRERTRSIVRGE